MNRQIDEIEFDYLQIIEKLHTINEIEVPTYVDMYHKNSELKNDSFYWQIMVACGKFYAQKMDTIYNPDNGSKQEDWNFRQEMWNLRYKKRNHVIEEYCKLKGAELERSKQNDLLTTISKLNQVRMKAIHQYLSDNKYIDIDEASWLYWFSLQTWQNTNKKPSKIKWIGAPYHLPNVVYLICGNMNNQTKAALKTAFELKEVAKLTKKNIKGVFYDDLKKMIGWAEREIKDLH
jgi:hypothetical protein